MEKKYKLVNRREDGLWQVKALRDFGNVKAGDLGGWIEKDNNLSHVGNSWVSGDARVFGNAKVYGNAWIYGDAIVYGDARVFGNAKVYGNTIVGENAEVFGDAEVWGDARVFGNAEVLGNAKISKSSDYVVFKNNTTSSRYFTYTFSNDSWVIGCFYGTSSELVQHLEKNGSELQKKEYMLYLELVKNLREIK